MTLRNPANGQNLDPDDIGHLLDLAALGHRPTDVDVERVGLSRLPNADQVLAAVYQACEHVTNGRPDLAAQTIDAVR